MSGLRTWLPLLGWLPLLHGAQSAAGQARELEATGLEAPAEQGGLPGQAAAVLDALARNRPEGRPPTVPVIDGQGAARFTFGSGVPLVICAPFKLCDLELERGEEIRDLQLGDQARWSVEVGKAGSPPDEVQHVILRPSDEGLNTTLLVLTDRRTYRLQLLSHGERFMPVISFSYPGTRLSHWRRSMSPSPGAPSRDAAPPARHGSLSALSFAYRLEGDEPPWKPERVYNDGLKTVIELPFAVRQTEAPSLLVVRMEGGLWTEDDVVQVNFRVVGTKYIVDGVFDIADLVVGVGPSQQRVRIRRLR